MYQTCLESILLLGIDHALRNTGLFFLLIDPHTKTPIETYGTTLSYSQSKHQREEAMVYLAMDMRGVITSVTLTMPSDQRIAILERDSGGGYNRYLQGEVRGIIRCRLFDAGWRKFYSYHPMTTKKVFTGSGKSNKQAMMDRAKVNCSHLADAMALVYTHLINELKWTAEQAENAVIKPST